MTAAHYSAPYTTYTTCTCGPYMSVIPPAPCPLHSGQWVWVPPLVPATPYRCPSAPGACNCTGACRGPVYPTVTSGYITTSTTGT